MGIVTGFNDFIHSCWNSRIICIASCRKINLGNKFE